MENTFWGMLRRKAGLTQEQFAVKAGVSVDTVRAWEGGRTSPSLSAAEKAAAVVSMRPVALLVGHAVESARKSVEQGESGGKVLRRAGEFLDLAEEADEEADAQVLLAGAEELLGIARSASKTEYEEADDGRDAFGYSKRKIVKGWRAMLTEHADPDVEERDAFGCQGKKIVRSQREGLKLQR